MQVILSLFLSVKASISSKEVWVWAGKVVLI